MAPPKLNRTCGIEGCDKPHLSRGFCSMHYRRAQLYGDPNTVKLKQLHGAALVERWNHYVPERGTGCWEWAGNRDPNGYGRLNVGNTPALAHRIAWELFQGPLTPEDHICHRCDNPPCVRPEHLFKGDHGMNMADKMRKKRHRYGVSRGEKHGCAVLTEAQAREIKASGLSHKACAAQYGVSYQTVWEIRKGVSWKHI